MGVEARVDEEREKLAQFKELFERRHALYEEQAELRRQRVLTERRIRALEQRVERERRRAERRVVSADGSRRGRPVRIEVDDEAWAVLKREAVQRRLWLVWWLGELVRLEVDALAAGSVSGPPSSRRVDHQAREIRCREDGSFVSMWTTIDGLGCVPLRLKRV